MFCDLVGSTALSVRLDPEDLREVIGAYHRCIAETVGRYDGFVARYMGDGVLAYSAIRKPMRMTPSGRCERDWLRLKPSATSKHQNRYKFASALVPG
jgi:class 3 adenylate cyclase